MTTAIALFIWGYYPVFEWMYGRFTGPDSYYSHGFFVPVVSGFLIWKSRQKLQQVPVAYSWSGLALILAAILLHLVGTILYIFFLSGLSMFVFGVGACLFMMGPRSTREILFPLFFLLFMIPLPTAIINLISFPLKMLVATLGVKLVQLTGIPVLREGFAITIPTGDLLVGNPCSGLRSLIAFLAIAAIFAHISNCTILKKVALFLSAVPIALLSNLIRVPLLIYISYFWGLDAARPETIWHTGSGILVFVAGFLLFLFAHKIIECKT